ncbi:tetratricopeptide repeat protein [Chryseolinea lacunae]|uniref:Tetratricopeptide repeat protein n=1 Tax=Chryseolinea lacunae TaxID=2801331 RepID=A0ABS1KQ54_9BACT|nr:tetratricopeptide repeat protein [Chryseolinea lacunae]MBL0740421.1 tetratricopeptide repeat protein [Chryseolinea lacunae]
MKRYGIVRSAMVFFGGVLLWVACSRPVDKTDSDAQTHLDSLLRKAIRSTNDLDFEQAHTELIEVITQSRKQGDEKNEILGNINMGALYIKYNAQEEALKYFLQSLELAQQYKKDDLLNTIYNNIGIVYATNNATDKAIEYYEKAIEISRGQVNKRRLALNYINMGTELNNKGNDSLALQYFDEALAIFQTEADTLNASIAINNTANLYYAHGQYDSALRKYKQAFAMNLKVKDKFYYPQYCLGLGKTYVNRHQYDSATWYLEESLAGFHETSSTESIVEAYRWLSRVAEASGRNGDALKFSNLTLAWKDSLLREKTTKWISELQMRYEFGKKENEIELLQAEATRQRQFWIGVVVVATIIALLLFYTLRTQNINLQQKNVILQRDQEVTRLTLEKNRVEREQLEKDILATEKLNALEQERMKQELTFKDRELATKTLHLVNKNEIFDSIYKLLNAIDPADGQTVRSPLDKAKKIIRGNNNMDQVWVDFKLHFEEVHPRFFSQLQEAYPDLSPNDLRLCAYLLIDLNSKEIAQIYNISPESIRKKKQRLREKLNLEKDEDVKILLKRYKATPY